ncbi:MAG TPA: condensation domain-containing protein [Candidatus Bathyarchaeia archaeon]|nr:condensation domain-containing protein [Candidatus Bathyarchaeia archaeon]
MLRELNEIEYISYAVGQPFNIVVMLRFNGYISKDWIVEIIDRLQKKHPLLQVRITEDDNGRLWFTKEEVGKIPVIELVHHDDSQALNEFHKQLTTPFDLLEKKLPLMRVAVLSSTTKSEIVICCSHTISDGFSMILFIKDMLKLLTKSEISEEIIDLPAKEIDLYSPKVRRMIPKSPFITKLTYVLLRINNFFNRAITGKKEIAEINIKGDDLGVYSSKLTKEQTKKFLEKCKLKRVSVQSAISTAFSQEYQTIGSPVNVRNRYNRDVGEAFGCYSGVTYYKKKYRKSKTFWQNAKRIQRQLTRSLRDRRLFLLQRIFVKKASIELLRKVGSYFIEIITKKNPFSLDNLGLLDEHLKDIDLNKLPVIESIYGGITSFLDTLFVIFYTFRDQMYFFYHYIKTKYSHEEIESYAQLITNRLITAIEN